MCIRFPLSLFPTLIGCSLLAMGCAKGKSDAGIFPVQGTVLVKGKPAAYAQVKLIPVDEDLREKSTAIGQANEEGEFQLSTRKLNDGARAGEYYVAVSWRIPDNPRSSDDPQFSKELLPAKFQDPEKSGVKIEISPNEKELPPIELNP